MAPRGRRTVRRPAEPNLESQLRCAPCQTWPTLGPAASPGGCSTQTALPRPAPRRDAERVPCRERVGQEGHLTGETPAWSGLNKLPPHDVVRAFEPYFGDIRLIPMDAKHRLRGIHPDFEWEAEELLSPTTANRLAHVPRKWLLSRTYVLQGRRKVCPGSPSCHQEDPLKDPLAPVDDVSGPHAKRHTP